MLSVFSRRQLYNNNKNIMNYCRTSTEKSIRRIVEREKPVFNKYLNEYESSIETVSMYKNSFAFLTLLSISSFMYLFLHRKR